MFLLSKTLQYWTCGVVGNSAWLPLVGVTLSCEVSFEGTLSDQQGPHCHTHLSGGDGWCPHGSSGREPGGARPTRTDLWRVVEASCCIRWVWVDICFFFQNIANIAKLLNPTTISDHICIWCMYITVHTYSIWYLPWRLGTPLAKQLSCWTLKQPRWCRRGFEGSWLAGCRGSETLRSWKMSQLHGGNLQFLQLSVFVKICCTLNLRPLVTSSGFWWLLGVWVRFS